jgi:hypothetical protein
MTQQETPITLNDREFARGLALYLASIATVATILVAILGG